MTSRSILSMKVCRHSRKPAGCAVVWLRGILTVALPLLQGFVTIDGFFSWLGSRAVGQFAVDLQRRLSVYGNEGVVV